MTVTTVLGGLLAALLLCGGLAAGFFVLTTRRIAAKAERLVPRSGQVVDIDGNRIRYVEAGAGRPILCVHGLGGQLHHFSGTLFDDLARDFRIIALDRPGSGYSVRARGASARLAEQARVISRFIEALQLDRPLIVGHSLGGAVALALAEDHPQAISGLALLAPLTRHRDAVPPGFASLYIRSPFKRWLLANTVAVPNALKLAGATLAYVFGPQAPSSDYMTRGGGWLGLRPSHIEATCADFVAIEEDMPRIERGVADIKMPVGVLFGTADKVLDYAVDGETMCERLPTVDFARLEGIGHMPQFVARDETLAFVRRMAGRAFLGAGRE